MPPRSPSAHGAMRSPSPARGARWRSNSAPAGIDSPELDARILVGHALGLDHAALAAADARVLERRGAKRDRRAGAAPARARAGGAHRRRQGILEPAAAHRCRDAGAAAGDRNRGRGRARGDRCRAARARGRCASPISAPAPARSCWRCSPNCRMPSASAPTSSLARACVARGQCPPSWLDARGLRRLRHGGGAARTVRPHRLQSALYRLRRHRHAGARSARVRSASGARRRTRRA